MKQILNRWTGKVMCNGLSLEVVLEKHKKWLRHEKSGERANLSAADLRAANLRAATLSAADLRAANLRDADLRDANLRDANLSAANLRDADLSDADLSAANLRAANLSDANLSAANLSAADLSAADLRDANLSTANLSAANLSAANLRDADLSAANLNAANLSAANLRDANLSTANLSGVPKIENIHQTVYKAASQPNALKMDNWHSCETTHCRAGWVVHLAGEAGAAMEFCMGTPTAAALIYLKSDPNLKKVPNFYADNETALADMKKLAEQEAA